MIGVMMTYKPSPKPNFFEPTHIVYNQIETYMWGDEEAGKVKDWIYISNESLHQIIFGLEPGNNFKHSDQYRTIFGADELLYVLSGVLIINNPETGETHKILPGESVFFQKDTWHHAFNYSEEYLQVLEFFSPPPITGTSGAYAREKKLLKNIKYKRDKYLYPSETFKNENSFKIIRTNDYIWSLEGDKQETLIGTIVKTQNLDVKIINLKPLQETNIFNFKKNTSYLSLSNNLEIFFDDKKKFLLSEKDGLYLPSNYSFKIKNLNNFDANIIFCIGI
tara:strand:+ start:1 stop:834 length:834 start_codon:yes stop_codon:yes gene_type:complete